jgi:hypothetical protein
MAEGVGFEPTVGVKPTLDFESSAFNQTQPPFRFCWIDNRSGKKRRNGEICKSTSGKREGTLSEIGGAICFTREKTPNFLYLTGIHPPTASCI